MSIHKLIDMRNSKTYRFNEFVDYIVITSVYVLLLSFTWHHMNELFSIFLLRAICLHYYYFDALTL